MADALDVASAGWVDLDEQSDHGRLAQALLGWANLTINAIPGFHGPPTARVVIAPSEAAEPGECLR
ncbi:hypothetical protein [Streptomyces sp. S186]|uniref:hypothetical protein n=1 Tax=Streptomyces sp. S186 TaxID=3434395 RepID=UPI003F66E7F0